MKFVEEIMKYLKSIPYYVWVLMVIIFVGIFLRAYNFHDWLQFKGDAFRDAIMVSHSFEEGPGSLPLLGPRAGGTQLHLGPIFYYFQYFSAFIFQSMSPVVLTFPDLLFSILAIPLFFLLVKEYFSPKLSLFLTFMLATCYMAVEYGRFAWNPNSTPFFTIVFLYSLLRAYDSNSFKKYVWLGVSGGALAVASQLHFSAFLGLPIIFVLFFILNWKKSKEVFSWKALLVFFGIIFVFYIPVILFDILTHGKNMELFFKAIGDKKSSRNIFESIARDAEIFAKYFLWIGAGIVEGKWWQEMMTGFLTLVAVGTNWLLFQKETNEKKKRFLAISLIFIIVYFVLYISLAYDIERSRFFLPLLLVPFIFVGYLFVLERDFLKTKYSIVIPILACLMIFGNMESILTWFSSMRQSENERSTTYEVLTEKDKSFWWTWERFEKAAGYMESNCDKDSIYFFISKKTRDYGDSICYALDQAGDSYVDFKEKYKEEHGVYGNRCYYYVSLAKESIPDSIEQNKYEEPFYAGDMRIIRWHPGNANQVFEIPIANEREDERKSSLAYKVKQTYPRLSWGDLKDLFK